MYLHHVFCVLLLLQIGLHDQACKVLHVIQPDNLDCMCVGFCTTFVQYALLAQRCLAGC